jgi:hypothetical protein
MISFFFITATAFYHLTGHPTLKTRSLHLFQIADQQGKYFNPMANYTDLPKTIHQNNTDRL